MSNETVKYLRVETPLGVLFARVQSDPDHPGIHVGLHSQATNQDLLLTLVEFCEDEGDLPDGKHCIITRVWDEALQDEYAYRHIHKGIEDYFKTDEDQVPAKAYTMPLETSSGRRSWAIALTTSFPTATARNRSISSQLL